MIHVPAGQAKQELRVVTVDWLTLLQFGGHHKHKVCDASVEVVYSRGRGVDRVQEDIGGIC